MRIGRKNRTLDGRGGAAVLALLFAWAATGACGSEVPRTKAADGDVAVFTLADDRIDESSGLAASGYHRDRLWTLNDSGGGPWLYAIGIRGQAQGRVRVADVENRDWEDLSAFVHRGRPHLLLADVGDNDARRASCELAVVEEPVSPQVESVPVAWRLRFRYPDGPRDCEAVAVDAAAGAIWLLTKRNRPPVLYRLPLRPPEEDTVIVAGRVAAVSSIPPPTRADLEADPTYGRFGSRPTAMELSPDGRRLLVLTYRRPYVFDRLDVLSWAAALGRPPQSIDIPRLHQAEGGCFSADGQSVFVISEQLPAVLLRTRIPQ